MELAKYPEGLRGLQDADASAIIRKVRCWERAQSKIALSRFEQVLAQLSTDQMWHLLKPALISFVLLASHPYNIIF